MSEILSSYVLGIHRTCHGKDQRMEYDNRRSWSERGAKYQLFIRHRGPKGLILFKAATSIISKVITTLLVCSGSTGIVIETKLFCKSADVKKHFNYLF